MKRTTTFAMVPDWVLYDPRLDPAALKVYCTLQRAANRGCREIDTTMLETATGLSVRSLRRLVGALKEIGAVEVQRRGQGKTSLYRLVFDRPDEAAETLDLTETAATDGTSETADNPQTVRDGTSRTTRERASRTTENGHSSVLERELQPRELLPPGDTRSEAVSCQELVAFYVDVCRKYGRDPTAKQRGAVAKQIQRLVSESKDRRILRRAVGRLAKENKPLSLIDFVVGDVEEELFVKERGRAAQFR